MLTGNILLSRMRYLLRDTGRGMATASRFYSDETLLRALNLAVAETAKDLIYPPPPRPGEPQIQAAPITTNGLSVTMVAASTTPVPTYFWFLVCGYQTSGGNPTVYVPATDAKTGERYYSLDNSRVYIKNQTFVGPQNSVLYVQFPQPVVASDDALAPFSDGFYFTAKLRACRDAIFQEDRDAMDRCNFLHQEYLRSIVTLK